MAPEELLRLFKLCMIPFFITYVHFTYLKIHPRIALYTQELMWTVSGVCGRVGGWIYGLVAVLEIHASAGQTSADRRLQYFELKLQYSSDTDTHIGRLKRT
jgi:F0F1-type ATP synthase assembly protein I